MQKYFLLLLLTSINISLADCPPARNDFSSGVLKIYDGDTFTLTNNERVRFIGINTPELGRNGKPDQLFAQQAKKMLVRLLSTSSNKVILQYGKQAKDHYKRSLAHVFLPDGTNVSEKLLRQGLAYRVAFPPNLWAQDCYQKAENTARKLGLGVWSRPVKQTEQLPLNSKGFHYIEGEIVRVGHSKKSVWLNFKGNLSVRIARNDLKNFKHINFDELKNKRLRVRGWIHTYKNENILRLRHSSMLEIMK